MLCMRRGRLEALVAVMSQKLEPRRARRFTKGSATLFGATACSWDKNLSEAVPLSASGFTVFSLPFRIDCRPT